MFPCNGNIQNVFKNAVSKSGSNKVKLVNKFCKEAL